MIEGFLINFISDLANEMFNFITKDDFESNIIEILKKLENKYKEKYPDTAIEDSVLASQKNIDSIGNWILKENIFCTDLEDFDCNNFDGTIIETEQKNFIVKELRDLVSENDILKKHVVFILGKDTSARLRKNEEMHKGIEIPDCFPLDYIERIVKPFNDIEEVGRTLSEVCFEKRRVILLADAGMGKTKELECLKYIVSKMNEYKIYSFDLSTYVDETIENYIDFNIDYEGESFIILDGFDEIEAKNINTFTKRFERFEKKYKKNIFVVISSRKNFYVVSKDGNTGTLKDFKEVELIPIEDGIVEQYLDKKLEDVKKFREEVFSKLSGEILKNPFYLKNLLEIYIKDKNLPSKIDLMDRIMKNRFLQDREKYRTTEELYLRDVKMDKLLQKMAFSLQCLNRQEISAEYYQELLDSNKDNIKLLQYSGIWGKNNHSNWKFEHNNFKEYLAAKFISTIELAKIKQIITYKEQRDKINPVWTNVLAFLVNIYKEDTLVKWLIEEHPSYVVQFEIITIELDKRSELVISILENLKNKNISIHFNQNPPENLADFGQSAKLVDYVVEEIKNSENRAALPNMLKVLQNFTEFYGQEEYIRTIMLEFCNDKSIDDYVKDNVIMVLSNSALYTYKIAETLVELFYNTDESYIRYGMYKFILEHNLQNQYVDFLIESVDKHYFNQGGVTNLSEKIKLEEAIGAIDSYDAIKKVLIYLRNIESYFFDSIYENIFNSIFKNIEVIYKNGYEDVLEDMKDLFIKRSFECDEEFKNIAKGFLEKFGKIFETYILILKEYSNHPFVIYLLEDIMDEQSIDDFINRYREDHLENKELFIQYAKRIRISDYRYEEIVNLVLEKDNIRIYRRELIDYKELEKTGRKIYFDALFDKEKYLNLVDQFIEIVMPNGILLENWHKEIKTKKELNSIYYDCNVKSYKDANEFRDIMAKINWEYFSTICIVHVLKSNYESIEVSCEQEQIIKEYCYRKINEVDFETDIVFKKDGYNFSYLIRNLLFFTNYYSLDYEKEIYLKMLLIPNFLFEDENNQNDKIPKYLSDRVHNDDIKKQIIFNIQNIELTRLVAMQHLHFCKENKLKEGLKLALDIWEDNEYSSIYRRDSLKYIVVVFGSNYIYDELLPKVKNNQLEIILEVCLKEKDKRLISVIRDENLKSKDGILYLKELIFSDSLYGLEKYYEIAKKNNKAPDYPSEDGRIAPITNKISKIDNFEALKIILKLAKLLSTDGFKDFESFGLYNGLCSAIKNIALNGNAIEIKKLIELFADENKANEKVLSFCYGNIESISKELHAELIEPWSLKDIKIWF